MTQFNALDRQKLWETFAFELCFLERCRASLFHQSESSGSLIRWNFNERTSNGVPIRTSEISLSCSISGQAVSEVYESLRPLVFLSAFKIHDMIAEWILKANGVHAWEFSKKVKEYRRLSQSALLCEPQELSARTPYSRAFWEFYSDFSGYRSAIAHSGAFTAHANGDLAIDDKKKGTTLHLTHATQAAYVRYICLLANNLTNRTQPNTYLDHLIETDLSRLEPLHGVPGFQLRHSRFESLSINVPREFTQDVTPFAFTIPRNDLNSLTIDRPVGTNGSVIFDLEVTCETPTRSLRWRLPYESIPAGDLHLREGDLALDLYLTISVP